jgi:hypothetical protein
MFQSVLWLQKVGDHKGTHNIGCPSSIYLHGNHVPSSPLDKLRQVEKQEKSTRRFGVFLFSINQFWHGSIWKGKYPFQEADNLKLAWKYMERKVPISGGR